VLKLTICLFTAAVVAICLLQLRQQNLQLGHQCNELHGRIRAKQGKLWNQQLQIAVYTAPNAISKTVANHDLNLVPQTPPPPGKPNWIDVSVDENAE
jgi:cell division protein FtsL